MMAWRFVGVFVFSAVSFAALLLGAEEPSRPNVVIILCDDLGYGDVHCFNPERSRAFTPSCDQLAMQGMVFTDAHSGSSVCTPTRYGLLTGRYAWRTRLQRGVLDNYVEPLIDQKRLTLGGLHQQQGYTTACIGKWHLGFTVDVPVPIKEKGALTGSKSQNKFAGAPLGARTLDGPLTRGFDNFAGFHHARMMESYFESDRVTRLVEPVDVLPLLARQAVAFLEDHETESRPYFLYLPLSAPHSPVLPSKVWKGKSGLGDYADFVMQTDAVVGEIVAAIDRTGQSDNTLVIVTSDNGCTPGVTKELETAGHFPSADLRGYKSDIWEGGHRVPFIVRWPAKVSAGSRSNSVICLTDIMATCADITVTALPDDAAEDSFSFLPDLMKTGTTRRTSIVHHSMQGQFAIRQGTFKLCMGSGSGGWSPGRESSASVQLYDLSNDNGERSNLQASHPAVVGQLTRELEQLVDQGRSTPGPRQRNDIAISLGNNR